MPKLLIAITSCERDTNRGYNQAIRETWLKEQAIDYRFFRGVGSDPKFADEIILDCADDYLSLPQKTLELLKWAIAREYDHVFKCDTDTYVNLPNLLSLDFQNYDYMGAFNQKVGAKGVVYDSLYSWASGGTGYFLSARAANVLIDDPNLDDSMCPRLKIPCEDLWVGQRLGPLIESGELKAFHEKSMNTGFNSDFSCQLSSHYCSEGLKRSFDVSWMYEHHQKNSKQQ
jgi:hypothetical protein